jgi:hypothetical protein
MDTSSSLIIIGLLVSGVALFSFLLSATILWGVTNLLKFKETSFKKSIHVMGALCLIIIVFGAASFGLSALVPSLGTMLLLILLLTCIASPIIFALLVKKIFNETWTNTIVAVVICLGLQAVISVVLYFALMIPMVVIWQLGVFNAADQGSVVTTGWAKLQPISASIAYRTDGSFQSTFLNTAGTTISITELTLSENYAPSDCSSTLIKGETASTTNPISVKAGDGFKVSSNCGTKTEGDPFDMQITIKYTANVGGITSERTETGHIRGPVEA